MQNVEMALVFGQLADLLELAGENPFKVRAYRRAAGILAGLREPAQELAARGELTRMPGIGRQIAAKIGEMAATGQLGALQEAAARFPTGLVRVMGLPGIGPVKARSLFEHLGVTGPAELAAAARAHRVRAVPGFGAKSEADILRNLAVLEKRTGLILLALARTLVADAATYLAGLPGVGPVVAAGDVRRWEELVTELELVVEAGQPAGVLDAAAVHPLVARVTGRDERSLTAATRWGVPLKVTVAGQPAFWATVLERTGPPAHVERLHRLAAAKDLALGPRGLCRGGQPVPVSGEEEIYRSLGLPFLPPETRGDGSEVDRALGGWRPDLLEPGQVRGDLHVHSRYSDGRNSLAELAAAAHNLGYDYLAVSDHSASLKVARGLPVEVLAAKNRAIDELNTQNQGLRLLKGAEVDILADGGLDYPDEVLAGLDVVIASVHTRFQLPAAEMTERVVRAVRNRHVHILGHPTGRLLNTREAYALDLERVVAEASAHDTWLEINASPERLDLSAESVRLAAGYGAKVIIGTDAHELSHLADMAYGVALARRAGVDPQNVVNTWESGELLSALRRKTKKGS